MDNFDDTLSPFDLAMGGANKLNPSAAFDGPVKQRRMNDPLCLIFLLATWGIASWVGFWSITNGNYDTLVHPADYKGRLCGVDADSSGQVLPAYWHPVDALSNGVCIAECPTVSNLEPSTRSDLICKEEDDLLAMDGCASGGTISDDPSVLVTCGGCMFEMGSTSMNDYCNPTAIAPIIKKVNEVAEGQGQDPLDNWDSFEYTSYLQRFMRDLRTGFPIVGGAGFGGAAVFGMLYLILFRFPRCIGPTIWASAVLVPATLGGAGALLFFLANDYELDQSGLHSNFKVLTVKILSYTAWAVSGLVLFSIVIMRTQISKAISISKAASRAMREVSFTPVLAIMQIMAYAITIGVLSFWFLMIASSRKFTNESETVFGYELSYTSQAYSVLTHYM